MLIWQFLVIGGKAANTDFHGVLPAIQEPCQVYKTLSAFLQKLELCTGSQPASASRTLEDLKMIYG